MTCGGVVTAGGVAPGDAGVGPGEPITAEGVAPCRILCPSHKHSAAQRSEL